MRNIIVTSALVLGSMLPARAAFCGVLTDIAIYEAGKAAGRNSTSAQSQRPMGPSAEAIAKQRAFDRDRAAEEASSISAVLDHVDHNAKVGARQVELADELASRAGSQEAQKIVLKVRDLAGRQAALSELGKLDSVRREAFVSPTEVLDDAWKKNKVDAAAEHASRKDLLRRAGVSMSPFMNVVHALSGNDGGFELGTASWEAKIEIRRNMNKLRTLAAKGSAKQARR